ncbi:ester cyclase [Chitinophaga sp. sic0106]|uniref:ester cyclase n=1 Tax=Chitinophaga sp. sic0106 TaxID=2854785 RepID=UPI001C46E9E9|nr:ester cyclase [Chitinophaga sp. sic0106]MBV7533432.1 ester cyclase [Chitinophaga sp. sic0106]
MQHTAEQNMATVRLFNEACLLNKDMETLDAIVHPDFINHTAAPGFAKDIQSLKTFILTGLSNIGDLKLDIHAMYTDGDTVITHKTFTGILNAPFLGLTAIGKPLTMRIIDIVELKNGQYIAHWSVREVRQA